jgi:Transglutaminase-like superfamily
MGVMWRLVRLPAGERLLLAEALFSLVLVRLWLPFASVDRLKEWARPPVGRARPLVSVVWAVRTAARRLPGTRCLPAALVLQRLLHAAGHESELHLGVAQQGTRLAAHAWVVREGEILIGDDTQTAYTSLLSWK